MSTRFQSMASVDGRIAAADEAHVPIMDRGFLFGDSVYEVFRTYDGVPLFFDEHWRRFENSARLIHMDIGYGRADVLDRIKSTVEASGAARAGVDVYVRFIVTRGDVGAMDLYPDPGLKPRLVVIVRRVPDWDPDYYANGLRVAVAETRRNSAATLNPNVKGGNYLNNILGVMDARRVGADDCLMLNDAGLVAEASNSNVFFVFDGVPATPSQAAANLLGLTKAAVHESCRAHGLATEEREIPIEDAKRAEECFLTSATREVMPVRSLRFEDGTERAFPAGGGPVTRRVTGYYREHVAAYVSAHAELSLFR
jgi:branched-chain amino acid aminotransferase